MPSFPPSSGNATALQGVPVANGTPSEGDVLTFDDILNEWTPQPSGGGLTLPIQTSADPETVVENAASQAVIQTDTSGNPLLRTATGNGKIQFDGNNNPQLVSADNQPVIGADGNYNGFIKSDGGNEIGFDSSGNPQINGAFGIPKVVAASSTPANTLGNCPPGQVFGLIVSLSGVIPGDFVTVPIYDGSTSAPFPSALGAMAFVGGLINSLNLVTLYFVNTDPVNNSNTPSGNINILVLRYP